jgi:hypothetical protein
MERAQDYHKGAATGYRLGVAAGVDAARIAYLEDELAAANLRIQELERQWEAHQRECGDGGW